VAPIVAIDVGQQPQRRPGGASGCYCAGRSADRARRVGARSSAARGLINCIHCAFPFTACNVSGASTPRVC
jgi:hypothetical protein